MSYCGLCANGAECKTHHEGWAPALPHEEARLWIILLFFACVDLTLVGMLLR